METTTTEGEIPLGRTEAEAGRGLGAGWARGKHWRPSGEVGPCAEASVLLIGD